MGKGTNFIGQPLLTQLLKFFDKDKILRMSCKCGGERYVKGFDGWHHLVVMLYAVLMRFDSLREITASVPQRESPRTSSSPPLRHPRN